MSNNNESNIRFRDLFSVFISNLWIMCLIAVLVGASVFAYNYFTYEPMYESTGSIYILRQDSDNDSGSDYNSDFNLALNVVNDCKTLLTSRSVLEQVVADNALSYTYDDMLQIVSVNSSTDTRLIDIKALTSSPEESRLIVESVRKIGKEQIQSIMGFDQVNIVGEATLPEVPSNSKFEITLSLLAAIAAFIVTYIIFALFFIFDDKISDPELIEKTLGLTVLAIIPNINQDKNSKTSSVYIGKTATKRQRYYANSWKENK